VQDPLADMILSGEVHDGDHVPIEANAAGLVLANRVLAGEKRPPDVVLN
jgi:ATP-dependent Clp protease ATP-binding subunit ClpB